MPRALAALPLLLLALLAGCGGGGARTVTAPTAPVAPTRAAHRPALPRGWHRAINLAGSFSFGLPPGWSMRATGTVTRVHSADRGLALSVTSDRGGGLASDPRAYATATLQALSGYIGLRVARARPLLDAPYPAAIATARGRLAATGLAQRVVAITLRPHGIDITYALLAFSSSARSSSRYSAAVERLVASFRAECCQPLRSGRSG